MSPPPPVPFAPDEDDWPEGSSPWESSAVPRSSTPLGAFLPSRPPVFIRRLHQTGYAFAHNRYTSTSSCEPSLVITSTTTKETREKSLLLLASSSEDAASNTWFVIPPATSLFGQHPTLPAPEHSYGDTHIVLIGSDLYLIGGYISSADTHILSNSICRLDISQPDGSWEICHVLPFYCHTTNVVVCGDLIYLFKENGFSSCARGRPLLDLGSKHCENWAYIYDTRFEDGWCISAPSDELCFREVLFCAYLYQNGPKVLVSVAGRMYLHNPRTNSWMEHSPVDAFFPGYDYMFAKVVSNGILYYLQCFRQGEEEKPFLSAYDLQKGSLMFQLEVDSFRRYSGNSYLLAVSDSTLCWINTGPQGVFLTKMSLSLHPTPSLVVIKRRKFYAEISGVACCLPIDLPYDNRLMVTNRPGPLHEMEDFASSLIRNKDVKDDGLKAMLV